MGSRSSHRSQVQLRRRRAKAEHATRATQTDQAAADQRRAFEHQQKRKVWAITCFVLAPIIFVTHMISHGSGFHLYNSSLEDLTIGYPTAFLVLIAGFRLL